MSENFGNFLQSMNISEQVVNERGRNVFFAKHGCVFWMVSTEEAMKYLDLYECVIRNWGDMWIYTEFIMNYI